MELLSVRLQHLHALRNMRTVKEYTDGIQNALSVAFQNTLGYFFICSIVVSVIDDHF
jgi:uncharacterized membrane protein (DUF106 family)